MDGGRSFYVVGLRLGRRRKEEEDRGLKGGGMCC